MADTGEHIGLATRPPRNGGSARAIICGAIAGLFGLLSALAIEPPVLLIEAKAQPGSEQRALVTVRDVSGIKGAPVPLGLQVQAPQPEGSLVTVGIGHLPKGAQLSDGSRIAVAEKERDLMDITGWDLPNMTLSMPSDATGQFTLTAVVTVENGGRPLVTETAFVVNIGQDRGSLASGPVRTVQAAVGPSQIAVRATQEANPAEQVRAGPEAPAPRQDGSSPPQLAATPTQQIAPRDTVAEALAADRKLWLELERTRSETLTRQLVAAHEQIGELKSKLDAPMSKIDAAEPPELKDAELSRLLTKANELIRPGDVSGARLLLERALETGSPEAAFYLAQTYDPRILESWNVHGISSDPEKARALYQRAHEAGLNKAKELVELMR
jgi:hypothetical protein